MTIRYRVDVLDRSGQPVTTFDSFTRLDFSIKASGRGRLSLNLGDRNPEQSNFEDDCLIQVWRKNSQRENVWENVSTYINRSFVDSLFQRGRESFNIYAPSLEDLITSAEIMYPSSATQSAKTGDVATVIAEYLKENIGSSATTINGRYISNVLPVTVSSSVVGLNWSGRRYEKELQNVCQELVNFAFSNGARCDYRVSYAGDYQFLVEVGDLGTDRTADGLSTLTGLNSAGNVPVIFSPLVRNLRQFTKRQSRYNEFNRVVALGAGGLVATAVGSNATISSISGREVIVSARTQDNLADLQAVADAKLYELESQLTFDVEPDPLQSQLFDNYNVFDYITIEDDEGNRVNRQISGANVMVQLSGSSPVETVELEYREL